MPDRETTAPSAEEPSAVPGERHSFDSVCGRCGALLPAGRKTCLVCRTPRNAVPYAGEFPVAGEDAPPFPARRDQGPYTRKSAEILSRWSMGVAGLILLLCLGLGGFNVYLRHFDTSSYRAGESVVYEAGERLMLSHPGLDRPLEITGLDRPAAGFAGGAVQRSPNGRWIAYTASDGRLYLVDLARRGVGPSDELTATPVAAQASESVFFSTNSEFLLYLTRGGDLYANDFSENLHLDTGVTQVVAAENQRVLYTRRGDKPGQLDLYLYYLPQDNGEWHVVDRDVGEVLDWTPGFERMLYTSTRQEEDGEEITCLQLFDFSKSPPTTATLAEGIGRVLDASAENGTAVYFSPSEAPWKYEDFVDDDLAAPDARLREPDLEDYPLVDEAFSRYGEDVDIFRWAVNEDLLEEFRSYTDAQAEWEDKQARDALRTRLRGLFEKQSEYFLICDLYVYREGAVRKLDSNVSDDGTLTAEAGQVSATKNYVAYQKVTPSTLRRIKMSAMWKNTQLSELEPVEYYLRNISRELRISTLNGPSVRVYPHTESTSYRQWRVAPGGDGIYFVAGPAGPKEGTGSLYYTPLKSGKLGDAALVERGVTGISGAFREGILFRMEGAEPGIERIFTAQGNSARPVGGAEAVVSEPVNEGQAILYLDDVDPQTRAGTLHLLAKEDRRIAGDVTGAIHLSDETIYLLRRGKARGSSNIFLWQFGQEQAVDQEASAVLGTPSLR